MSDIEPYGPEWEASMMKMTKREIVEMLGPALKQISESRDFWKKSWSELNAAELKAEERAKELTAEIARVNAETACCNCHIGLEKKNAELTAQVGRMKSIALKSIDDEEEFPGEMPEEMFKALRDNFDKETISEAMRLTVRLTKKGIRERFQAAQEASHD